MVTKRARRWLARGTLVTTLVVVAVAASATWVLSSSLRSHLLEPPAPVAPVVIRSVGTVEVTLDGTDLTRSPGRWGLRTATGYAELGEITRSDDTTVTRRIVARRGLVTPGLAVFDPAAFGTSPSDRDITHRDVILDGPRGDHAAWSIPAGDDTWLVFVHDFGGSRADSLRTLGVADRLGLSMVVPAMGGDPEAPPGTRRTDLGAGEWRDVEAAIKHAFDSGAVDVVLVGHGTGASTAVETLERSRYRSLVVGVVLDGPLLDPAGLARAHLGGSNTPGFLIGWAQAVATFRFGIEWSNLDHLANASAIAVPVLVFHGEDDDRFPIEDSRFLAENVEQVSLEVVAGAGHGHTWNVDPVRYESVLEDFLRKVAVGPSGDD